MYQQPLKEQLEHYPSLTHQLLPGCRACLNPNRNTGTINSRRKTNGKKIHMKAMITKTKSYKKTNN